MGLSTSRSKKKQFKEPKFFKTLPESVLREDDIFYENIKAHIEEAFGARNFGRGSHVIQDSVRSCDAPKIIGVIFSCLDALTNNGLYLIAMILSGDSEKFEKTRCKMKKIIRESLQRCLGSETFQFHHAAVRHVLDGLEDLPFQTLIAMDRKLRCLKSLPQLQACGRGKNRKRLINKVSKTAKRMLIDLDKVGKLQEPLAKALAVADLSLKLTTGYRNTSTASFHQFSPEIISLQNDIVKAIWVLKMKVRFPELKTLKLLLDPNVDLSNLSLRGAITNMLTEFLFECSDMDTIPKSLLEALSVINKDSRSMPHGCFLKDDIEEEIESTLSVSAQMKQIVWDLLPDHGLDEEFSDAYEEELSDDDSCIEDDGSGGNDEKMGNKDLESCMSHSVNSIERDEVIQDMKVDPENASSNEKGRKLLTSSNRNCLSPFNSSSGESIERDEVEQNNGVDPEKPSILSSNIQLANVHNNSNTCRNQYLTIQEACDETSLVAYNLIGWLLEKFAEQQDMDLDWSDSLYLRGDSSIQEHTQEGKQKLFEEDMGDNHIEILKELMLSVPKRYLSYPPGKWWTVVTSKIEGVGGHILDTLIFRDDYSSTDFVMYLCLLIILDLQLFEMWFTRSKDQKDNMASLIKQNEKGKEGNGFGSGLDVKKGVDLNWNGLNSGLKGSGLKVDALDFIALFDQNEPVSNVNVSTLSWDPSGTNASRLNSNVKGLNSNASRLSSSLVDENEEFGDDGWEFKTAESETRSGTDSAKMYKFAFSLCNLQSRRAESREQENPKGAEFGFGFQNDVNGPRVYFGTSGGISNKPGEWDLRFSFDPTFGTENKTNDTQNEPKVADASSDMEDFSFDSHNQGNEERLEKHNGAVPLSIFGDVELETDESLRYEDVSIHKPTSPRAGMKDTHSNISISDLISSLYSQADKKASLNHISIPSENGLLSSQMDVGSNLVNGDNDSDDGSWEFKGAVPGTRGENQNPLLSFGDSYEKYSTKLGQNDYVDFYSKLTAELCFVALSHLDKMKKDGSIAASFGEDAEVKAIEKEIQAEKVLRSATELLKHAASTLEILKLGSVKDQSTYVSTWSRILSVCALELRHGGFIWQQALQKNIRSQLLSKPQSASPES
ncbi:hypothetical protein REPUB_Repub06bG0019900 [Reevesia pubescens]